MSVDIICWPEYEFWYVYSPLHIFIVNDKRWKLKVGEGKKNMITDDNVLFSLYSDYYYSIIPYWDLVTMRNYFVTWASKLNRRIILKLLKLWIIFLHGSSIISKEPMLLVPDISYLRNVWWLSTILISYLFLTFFFLPLNYFHILRNRTGLSNFTVVARLLYHTIDYDPRI